MVSATYGDGELIAHFSRKGAALCKSKVVGICWPSPADKAGLLGNKLDVIAVANPARLGKGEHAFIDSRLGALTLA